MYNIERILSECFWDYNFSEDEILNIVNNGNKREKNFLFEKIFINSTDVLCDIEIFVKKDITEFLANYKVPKFNFNFLNRRYKILKFLILKQKVDIPELRWEK